MEPKNPIIIDGVNVRECECMIEDYYYQQANNLANGYKHIKNVCELGESGSEYYKLFCKDNPNCYFKQLARKEKENQRYEQTLTVIEDIAKENIRIADLEGLNGVYRRGLAEQILQKISEVLDE